VRPAAAYLVALLLGLAYAAWLFPLQSLWPGAPLHMPLIADEAVSAIGQRYFLAAPWGWPPLDAPRLAAPGGTNIALTDSVPLAMLLLKPFRSMLPQGFFLGAGWVALVWALQPVAAIYALRGAGERRAAPSLAIAVLSVSMPTLLARYGHTALCTHAAILAALGVYLRLTAGPCRWTWAFATLLLAACLLIHPYILAMVAGVLAATPLSLLARGDRRWRTAALWFAGTCAALGTAAFALGFGGTQPADGFGFYSMNLLGPLLPSRTDLWPTLAIDATGGQAVEGFQYFGAGLLALLALVAAPALSGPARLAWRRHAGLALALAAMAIFSLSSKVFVGRQLVLDLGAAPDILQQFRATARFFWPVAYTAMLAGVLLATRAFPPRAAAAVLALAAALQVADTAQLRASIQSHTAAAMPWSLDEPSLAPIFAAHDRMTLWPSFGCGAASTDVETMQAMLIASQTTLRTNTMFSARTRGEPDCDPAPVLSQPLRPGELRVIQRPGEAWRVPGAAQACRRSAGLVLCTADTAALGSLPRLQMPDLPLGQELHFPQSAMADALGPGWSNPAPDGVWSAGRVATLLFRDPPGLVSVLTVQGVGFASAPGGTQAIDVTANGAPVATWQAPDLAPATFTAALPADAAGRIVVQLHVREPARPVDRGMNTDKRTLGFLLRSLRLNSPG